MTEFFDSCVTLHAQLTDADPATHPAAGTPPGPELADLEDGQGGPRCEVCSPAEETIASALDIKVDVGPPVQEIVVRGLDAAAASPDGPEPPTKSGVLQPIAAKVLMEILCGARMARYDLLRAVCQTASCITKWTEQRDMDLFRFVCYTKCTFHYRMTSWVGDRMEDVLLMQYYDADLASDIRTHRSTSASYQAIRGPYTRAGQSMGSQRQTCVSHSTLEAEIVAADLALRKQLLAALPLWEMLLGRQIRCLFLGDKQAVRKVIKAGGSMKLMHLPRTHRIDAAAVSEQFSRYS
eukprot:5568415-Pyramimonas_sp.AAC.1